MAGVPYIFGNATTSIPLTNLDADFNTPVTIGNTTVGLGNTVTTLGNVTLNNVTITSGTVNTTAILTGFAANAVIYSTSTGNATSNASVFSVNGTNVGIGTSSPVSRLSVAADETGYTNDKAQITVVGATNSNQRVFLGYNTSTDKGFIQATKVGTAYQDFLINPSGGNVGIGVTPNATNIGGTYKLLSVGTSGGSGIFMGQTDSTDSDSAVAQFFGKTTGASGSQLAGGMIVFTDGSSTTNAVGRLAFYTATGGSVAERMRIDSSGNLLVGSTTSNSQSGIGFKVIPSATYPQLSMVGSATTNAATTLEMYSTGAAAYRFYVGYGGTIFATSIVISAISDQRLKENIKDIDTGLNSIMALKPRRFDWKDGKGQDKKNVAGFIAQEFETVFPECVSLTKAGQDGIEYKNINHETLIPTLVKAIQELNAKVTALETQLGVK